MFQIPIPFVLLVYDKKPLQDNILNIYENYTTGYPDVVIP